ncbi:UDP-N-acetylglucosamine 2-epimerase (non-hydrolyzing) [Corynebacterium aquatimens]|uniref:non-hydrolyzing UDP-N-acetylglucosamine 2-epimerase n=1 Tax=Corynebacterium TaxID=1716 RepID=UPI001F310A29|nr:MULTISPECIES: UDP-N-acetylglucosamine 2-epimerase (non-hydrolyzing) [Corynebacterium]QYH19408.1 UDP-N-acetylglucosamine 2-epimerase (non-hydrolyzing) [Corynebacterium aquatimens]UIZ91672.1 UDP-N-acetylglucosamine 2-epimerase (non-hydrolyzing) [Corynebacterium sp. CNCTC7651]
MSQDKPSILAVYGTRPEAIKLAPVIRALRADDRFDTTVVSTGQHREMLRQVVGRFGIEPDFDLDLMANGQPLSVFVARALEGLHPICVLHRPNITLVQGDTSTALAGALAGFHVGSQIAHLEAGLRTGNLQSPFPEEANRRMIAQISSLHLAPTPASAENLRAENIRSKQIAVTGNTVIDALNIAAHWDVEISDSALRAVIESGRRIVLVTAHRRENRALLQGIGQAVRDLATEHPDDYFVLPLHPNPRVREPLGAEVAALSNVLITDPLPYDQFIAVMNRAHLVLTDSGGIQEEAPSLGKPVLVMRENTERPEAVIAGTVKLVGTKRDLIVAEVSNLLNQPAAYDAMANAVNPYGDGHATERTVAALAQLVGAGERIDDFEPEFGEHAV